MWSIGFKYNDHVVEIDSGTDSILFWLDGEIPVAGCRLCLSLKPLVDMSDEDILTIIGWFRQYGHEVGIINDAEEAHYSEQFVSDEDLEVIINSNIASDKQKQAAQREQHYRLNGGRKVAEVDEPKKPKLPCPGYIYLAYSETGHYKIGKSKGPEDRIKIFDTQMPVEVTMIHTFEANDMREAEGELQDRYLEKHIKGEWFELDAEDVKRIKTIAGYANGEFIGANDGGSTI